MTFGSLQMEADDSWKRRSSDNASLLPHSFARCSFPLKCLEKASQITHTDAMRTNHLESWKILHLSLVFSCLDFSTSFWVSLR